MGAGPQTSEYTIWSIEVDWISRLHKGSMCIFALILDLQEQLHQFYWM